MTESKHPKGHAPEKAGKRPEKNTSSGAGTVFGAILAVALLVLVGWFLSSARTPSGQQASTQAQPQQAATERAQDSITVLTGTTSGIYYPVGVAFAQALSDMGYKAQAVATGGTADNISSITTGKGELAIAMIDNVIMAMQGVGAYEGKPPVTDMRAMMGLWPDVVQIVATADSGIKSFADLRGKCVGVGALKSGTEINARMTFEAHGMSYKDASVEFISTGEAVDMMLKGECHAAFVTSGLGNATVKKLAEAKKVTFVPVEGAARQRLIQQFPVLVESSIPKEVYGTDADAPTVAVMNIMLASRKLPSDVVYNMLSGFYSEQGLQTIGASHATAQREIKLATALRGILGTSIQLHPGAERFYREKGLLQ